MSRRSLFGLSLILALPLCLAFGPFLLPSPEVRLEGAVVTAQQANPRVTFSLQTGAYQRDAAGKLFVYAGDSIIISANPYLASGAKSTSTAFNWKSMYSENGLFSSVTGGRSVVLRNLKSGTVRVTTTWTGISPNITASLTLDVRDRTTASADTLTTRLVVLPQNATITVGDSIKFTAYPYNAKDSLLTAKVPTWTVQTELGDEVRMNVVPHSREVWVIAVKCGTCRVGSSGVLRGSYGKLAWYERDLGGGLRKAGTE